MIEVHPHTNRGKILSPSRKARSSISVGVNNLTQRKISEGLVTKVAERVLERELALKKSNGKIKEKNLSIVFVGPKKSKELNKQYRNKDKVANVLSFSAEKESTLSGVEGSGLGGAEGYLGEIVLCPAEIQKDAKKYGMMFEQALSWMLIHGVLHLLGYDHESEKEATLMEEKEQTYLKHI